MISPARLRTLASVSFAIFLALLPFEPSLDVLRLVLPALSAALLLLADVRERFPEQAMRATILACLPRLGFYLGIFVLPMMILGSLLLLVISPASDAREQITEVLKRPILFLLFAPPLALRLVARTPKPLHRALLLLPLVMGAWNLISACYSLDPEESLSLFSKESGIYSLAFYVAGSLIAQTSESLCNWLRTHLVILGVTGFAAATVALLAYLGPTSLFDWLVESDLIRSEFEEISGRIIRAQLLFGEHNRLASYLLVGLLMSPLLLFTSKNKRDLALVIASALFLSLGIVFTGTRGALLAAGVGLMITAVSKPKLLAMLCGIGLIATLLLPSPLRRQALSIFDPNTYTEAGGNVRLRLEAWENTLEMIQDRPIFGFGYGWPLYEDLYKEYNADHEDVEEKPHAHNNVLEITAETGLIGGTLFTSWSVLLGAGLFFAALNAPRGSEQRQLFWAALGLWAGLHVFGMTNYSLRRTVGAAVWIGWAVCSAILTTNPRDRHLNADI